MRYNTPLFFVCAGKKEYDPDAGEWKAEAESRVKRWANVTHMSAERQQAVFGDIRSDRYVIRLRRPFKGTFDAIEIDGVRYLADTERYPSDRQSLVVVKNG